MNNIAREDSHPTSLRAGASSVEITPPPGVRLSGFAGRPSGNTGQRDPLRASALYLSNAQTAALLITVDIIGLTTDEDRRWREELAASIGISPDAVMISCTHTHSGPATMDIRATGDLEIGWTAEVLNRTLKAAGSAAHCAQPVQLAYGSAICYANTNRRLPTPTGISLQPNPGGPCDHTCRLLLLRGTNEPVALLAHYAMHPVSLGSENLLTSPDWVAAFRDRVELQSGVPVLFLQGCCGDINPAIRGAAVCDALGLDLAGSVLTGLNSLYADEDHTIAYAAVEAQIPVSPLPSEEALQKIEKSARQVLNRTNSLAAAHIAEAEIQWVQACRSERPIEKTYLDARVSALRIGSTILVGLPGEIFNSIGSDICADEPAAWPLGYAAANLGYLYPDTAFREGGYEVDLAYKLYGTYQAAAGTADALTTAAHNAIQFARTNACSVRCL